MNYIAFCFHAVTTACATVLHHHRTIVECKCFFIAALTTFVEVHNMYNILGIYIIATQ